MKNFFIIAIGLLFFTSCANYKDIPYFQNAAEVELSQLPLTIKPMDMLSIFVFSGQRGAVEQFNKLVPSEIDYTKGRIFDYSYPKRQNYLVDNNGEVNYPFVGKIKVAGLNVSQANELVKSKIAPFIKNDVDYIVNTYIENYEVTDMGDVKTPQTFTTSRNKMTVLEALAKAGDMTIYGKRDCVKLLREKVDGEYEIYELDLRDAIV